jgi:choloylglycine hydrolase
MCTRILWQNGRGVFAGRSMDWPESTEPMLTVMPRGMQRDGGLLGRDRVERANPARWTSKYGSIGTTVYGLGLADGLNEAGLGGHMLYLRSTDFGRRQAEKPGYHAALWLQAALDNAATVAEALAYVEQAQPVMIESHGFKSTVHLALDDASGDSAIIEYIDGKAVIHHGRQYRIMTNDPTYDEQLALLAERDYSNPGFDTPVPGNVKATDRFQRAAYFMSVLREPKDERQAVASALAIVRNCSVPFGAPYGEFGVYNTEYRTVMNLTDRRYFFELTTSPNVVWVDLDKFDLSVGAPVMGLNPDDIELSGNVSERFTEIPAPY